MKISHKGSQWIVSARFDLAFLIGPALLSLAVLAFSPAELVERDDLPVLGWLILIPLVDVSHVYASLYRTYLDPTEFRRRQALYLAVPALVFVVGTILYASDPRLFWTVLAYTAVFHFVRQQYGFLALYRHRAGEPAGWQSRLDTTLLYFTTIYPLVWWHTHLPRKFVWFIDGDFIAIGATGVSRVVGFAYAAVAMVYVAKEIANRVAGRSLAVGKNLLIAATALTWYVGIVHYDSDFSFTVTNVVSHGVPYVALVWLVSGRSWKLPVFVGLLVALALFEEGLWDLLVWGEHASVFGGRQSAPSLARSPLLPFVVAALTVPQATHYVLDGFIWKMNRKNPELRELLLG